MFARQPMVAKQLASSKSPYTSLYSAEKRKVEKQSGASTPLKQQNLRRPLVSSKPLFTSQSTTETKKDIKIQGTTLRRDAKFTPIKSQLLSSSKDPASELKRELTKYQNENAYLISLTDRNKKIPHGDRYKEKKLSQIRANHQVISDLSTRLHNKQACKTHITKNQEAKEDKLQNTKESLQHINQLSHDRNLWRLEDLNSLLEQVTSDLKEKDKKIKNLKEMIEWEEHCFNRQFITEQRRRYNKCTRQKSPSTPRQLNLHWLDTSRTNISQTSIRYSDEAGY